MGTVDLFGPADTAGATSTLRAPEQGEEL